jgi:hypothetical protein
VCGLADLDREWHSPMGYDRNLGFILLCHRLNMQLDLQSFFGLLCTLYSSTDWLRPRQLPPSPRIWAQIRGRYWSVRQHIFVTHCFTPSWLIHAGSIRKVSPTFSVSIWVIICHIWKNIQKLRGKILYFFTPQSWVNPVIKTALIFQPGGKVKYEGKEFLKSLLPSSLPLPSPPLAPPPDIQTSGTFCVIKTHQKTT